MVYTLARSTSPGGRPVVAEMLSIARLANPRIAITKDSTRYPVSADGLRRDGRAGQDRGIASHDGKNRAEHMQPGVSALDERRTAVRDGDQDVACGGGHRKRR